MNPKPKLRQLTAQGVTWTGGITRKVHVCPEIPRSPVKCATASGTAAPAYSRTVSCTWTAASRCSRSPAAALPDTTAAEKPPLLYLPAFCLLRRQRQDACTRESSTKMVWQCQLTRLADTATVCGTRWFAPFKIARRLRKAASPCQRNLDTVVHNDTNVLPTKQPCNRRPRAWPTRLQRPRLWNRLTVEK